MSLGFRHFFICELYGSVSGEQLTTYDFVSLRDNFDGRSPLAILECPVIRLYFDIMLIKST